MPSFIKTGNIRPGKTSPKQNPEFRAIHKYYGIRRENPLKNMRSVVAVACKVIRIFYVIQTKDVVYDPAKMLGDIRRHQVQKINSAQISPLPLIALRTKSMEKLVPWWYNYMQTEITDMEIREYKTYSELEILHLYKNVG